MGVQLNLKERPMTCDRIYLDHNATTPVAKEVLTAMVEALENCPGNPSSIHQEGQRARSLIEKARSQMADLLEVFPHDIYFTSGGTEANNLALFSRLPKFSDHKKAQIISTPIEHPCILNPLKDLQKNGRIDLKFITIDATGKLDLEAFSKMINENTALVTTMLVNNETGTIFPVEEIAKICHSQKKDVPLHCDAIQAIGRFPVYPQKLGVDSCSISAHKFYGPKGIGALWVREGSWLKPRILGGGQEAGIRSGTENLPGIVGMGAAALHAKKNMNSWQKRIGILRDELEKHLKKEIEGVEINAFGSDRIYSTSNLHFKGVPGDVLQQALDLNGIAVSTGSACSSGTVNASPVLLAMGFSKNQAKQSIRISLGSSNSQDQIQKILDSIKNSVIRIRQAL